MRKGKKNSWKMSESENKTSFKLVFKFKCDKCSKAYPLKHILDRHIRMAHNRKKDKQCSFCGKNFYNLHMHLFKHFGDFYIKDEKLYQCKKCDNVYIELHDFMNHATESNCFKKPKKRKKERNSEKQNQTVKRSYKSSNYKCEQCSGSFTQKGGLMKHIQLVHEKIRSFKCDICNRSVFTKFDLKVHVTKVHNKSKMYKCNSCDKSFDRKKDGLDKHVAKVHR